MECRNVRTWLDSKPQGGYLNLIGARGYCALPGFAWKASNANMLGLFEPFFGDLLCLNRPPKPLNALSLVIPSPAFPVRLRPLPTGTQLAKTYGCPAIDLSPLVRLQLVRREKLGVSAQEVREIVARVALSVGRDQAERFGKGVGYGHGATGLANTAFYLRRCAYRSRQICTNLINNCSS